MRHIHKADLNQKEIVLALRRLGCRVWVVNKEMDLVVGVPSTKTIIILEVKNGSRSGLRERQEAFFENWTGFPVYRVNDVEDALLIVNELRPPHTRGAA